MKLRQSFTDFIFATNTDGSGKEQGADELYTPCSYFLIYVYEILGSVDHVGLLKVGDTVFKLPKKASELVISGSVHVHPTMGKL